jgi:hypothetical protein
MKKMSTSVRIDWIIHLILVISIFVSLASPAISLGITPARTVLDYESGKTIRVDITIINNENQDMKLIIYPDGPLAKLVGLEPKMITMRKDEQTASFNFDFMMPSKGEISPGEVDIPIKILQVPNDFEFQGQAGVAASIQIIHQIRIQVPYEGKYLEAREIFASSNGPGQPVEFTIPLYSR